MKAARAAFFMQKYPRQSDVEYPALMLPFTFLWTKKKTLFSVFFQEIGTEDGTRTHKPVRALPPQGSVSTNSTTSVLNT